MPLPSIVGLVSATPFVLGPPLTVTLQEVTDSTLSISGTSPSSATTAVLGSAITGLDRFRSLYCEAALVGATGGTLDVYLQVSPNLGTNWIDYAHFTQLAAAASAIKYAFTISRDGQSNNQATGSVVFASPAIVTVGTALNPLLGGANMVILGGDFTDRIRCVVVSGAGTSAGATQTFTFVGST